MSAASDLFAGPVELMLAKAQESIPRPATGTAAWAFEMKWDGFRAALQVRPDGEVRYWSRRGTDLSTAFPDLVAAAEGQVPVGVVLDGEAVVFADGTLCFEQLQHRMASRPAAVAQLARQHPASFVAFDVLAVAGVDVRHLSWRDRRRLLDEFGLEPPFQVSPYTEDRAVALGWLAEPPPGVEGVVSKGQGSRYQPGVRGWLKTKTYDTEDAVIGAVIGPIARPDAVVVGRYTSDGRLRIFGRSTALSSHQAAELATILTGVPADSHPWPAEIGSGHFGGGPVTLTHVDPVVVAEIASDRARQAGRARHAVRLVRLRLDLTAADVSTS